MVEQGEGKRYAVLYTWNTDGKPGLIMTKTRQSAQELAQEQLKDDKEHGRTTLSYIVEIPDAVETVREYIKTKLHLWYLASRLEDELGVEELGDLGDTTDFICSGLDDAPDYQAVNMLFDMLNHIEKDHGLEITNIKDYTTEAPDGKGT